MNGRVAELVATHPYLFSNLPLCGLMIALACLKPDKEHRRVAFFSGLACMSCVVLGRPNEDYWHPVLLFKAPWRVEDLVYLYWTESAAWMAAALGLRQGWTIGIRSRVAALCRMLPLALAAAVFLGLWLAGMNVMTANLVTVTALLVFLLGLRRSLWRLALAGMITYTPFYVLVVKIQFAIWPGYISYWRPVYPWGRIVLGIPWGEIAWPLAFGAMWPALIAWALDLRIGEPAASAPRAALL